MTVIKTYVEYVALQFILAIVQILPIEMCAKLCHALAWLLTDVLKFRSQIIDDNIRGVFPELPNEQRRSMAREMWYHLALMAAKSRKRRERFTIQIGEIVFSFGTKSK